MHFRPKISIFLSILLIASALFIYPKAAQATVYIGQVRPIVYQAGDDLVIDGLGFGDKKGNIYIGQIKYPYYGHAIKTWTDSKIVLSIDKSSRVYSGSLGIQPWDTKANKLSHIIYGPDVFVKAKVNSISPNRASLGSTISIGGSYFKQASQSKPLIYVNDVLAEVVFHSDRQIKFLLPQNAKSGMVKIVFPAMPQDSVVEAGDIIISHQLDGQVEVSDQWYLENINANKAKEIYKGSRDIIVAVIDDGIYLDHPDLKNNIWRNNNEIADNGIDDDQNGYIDDVYGWNFVYGNNDLTAFGTHGTMVAGIIGAYSNGSGFVSGLNDKVALMPIIVSDDYGSVNPLDIKEAIFYAVKNGADIINLSLGSSLELYSSEFDEAISYAYKNNVLLVAAAGNGDLETGLGRDLDKNKVSPICNDNGQNMVLGVGASTYDKQKTKWTNYGACVDIYAPGVDITSTASPFYTVGASIYKSASGTSFSAPMVSGAAALLKSKYPDIGVGEMRDIIINKSKNINNIKLLDVYSILSAPFSGNIYKGMSLVAGEKIDRDKTLQYISREKSLLSNIDLNMSKRLSGRIVLQVEEKGEAWYIFPDNKKKYYLGTAEDAYDIMRKLGLGAKHDFIYGYDVFPDYVRGKILLDVELHGEAYYINPEDGKAYYMKTGQDAYDLMRRFGLGISNNDLRKINIGEIN